MLLYRLVTLLLKPISLLKKAITSAGASGAGTVIKQSNTMRHLALRLAQTLKSFIWSVRDVVQVPFVKLRLIAWSKPITRGYVWCKSSTIRMYQMLCFGFFVILDWCKLLQPKQSGTNLDPAFKRPSTPVKKVELDTYHHDKTEWCSTSYSVHGTGGHR